MDFLHYLSLFRSMWLSGRPGGGKTALALQSSSRLIEGGVARYIVCNMELSVGREVARYDSWDDVAGNVEDAAVILDEAWLYVGRASAKTKDFMAYVRKRNLYLICPSVLPLAFDFKVLTVQRVLSLMHMGVPLWVYQWELSCGKVREHGRYLWWRPQSVFGWYNHEALPLAEWVVYDCLSEPKRESDQSGNSRGCGDSGSCDGGGGGVCVDVVAEGVGSSGGDSYAYGHNRGSGNNNNNG